MTRQSEHIDVLIIGAGISGIGAAHYLQTERPGSSYAILEARGVSGGTWALFRYPGIRSDSDLHTFGYAFKPWRNDKSIATADLILDYLRETAGRAASNSASATTTGCAARPGPPPRPAGRWRSSAPTPVRRCR